MYEPVEIYIHVCMYIYLYMCIGISIYIYIYMYISLLQTITCMCIKNIILEEVTIGLSTVEHEPYISVIKKCSERTKIH